MNERERGTSARRVATQVLFRVARDGAYAAAALDAELRRSGLDARDTALATELVYGTLRGIGAIDRAIQGALRAPDRKLDAWVLAALRVAAYQILHLDRVPTHAAVDEAVGIVRSKRGPKLGGFSNAVLRQLARRREETGASPPEFSVPAWFDAALTESLGESRARAFLEGRPMPPPVGLWVPGHRADRAAVCGAILAAHPSASFVDVPWPDTAVVRGAGDPHALPGYAEGHLAIQELGAQLVARAARVGPGMRVLDACAGRGGKSLRFLDAAGTSGSVVAVDLDERKLENIPREAARLGLPAERLSTEAIDLARGVADLGDDFDVVVVDAPCSAFGTVHRRPEILLRASADDPKRMAELQLAILRRAATRVRVGGHLVYAVCSPMAAEGPGVLRAFGEAAAGFALDSPADRPDDPRADADGVLRLGPWFGDMDAYQVVRWRRER